MFDISDYINIFIRYLTENTMENGCWIISKMFAPDNFESQRNSCAIFLVEMIIFYKYNLKIYMFTVYRK